jgi:hypothetical protein
MGKKAISMGNEALSWNFSSWEPMGPMVFLDWDIHIT